MQIYLHRANTKEAVQRAKENGWGIEIDVRFYNGCLRVMHDYKAVGMPSLYGFLCETPQNMPVILDIKEQGILKEVRDVLYRSYRENENTYLTDLMINDVFYGQKLDLNVLPRFSRWEPSCIPDIPAYWLDYLFDSDFSMPGVPGILVSPELHGKKLPINYIEKMYESENILGVCTDYPDCWEKLK